MAPPRSTDKENAPRNVPRSSRTPPRSSPARKTSETAPPHPHRHLVARSPARPPTTPVRARGAAARKRDGPSVSEVTRYIASVAAHADKPPRARLVTDAGERLLRALAAAVELRSPRLLASAADLIARLSAEPDSAKLLANRRYLAVLEAALARDAAAAADGDGGHAHVLDAWRGAARAVRNLGAFAEGYARFVARETQLVRLLVRRLEGRDAALHPHAAECIAALANIIRYGNHFQSYVHKHGGLRAAAQLARVARDPSARFHSLRALAEFSLNGKWIIGLISEGVIGTALIVIDKEQEPDIAAEATRCVGNMAASKVGREAVMKKKGLEKVVNRATKLGVSVQGTLVRDYKFTEKDQHLGVDLFRAMANLCVDNKIAVQRLVDCSGIMALISACDDDGARASEKIDENVKDDLKKEAFRGLLIVAQAGPNYRATVLREIGIRIRHDTILGRTTSHLYDLGRRIKVEASTEYKDDIPMTIAGLGSASRSYLKNDLESATDERSSNVANSVPGLQSPAQHRYRQSGRVLSVQRHIPHHVRLEMERRRRNANNTPGRRGRSDNHAGSGNSGSSSGTPVSRRSNTSAVTPAAQTPSESKNSVDGYIPDCTVVDSTKVASSGSNLVVAALQAIQNITNAMSGSPGPSEPKKEAIEPVTCDTFESADTFDEIAEDQYEIGVPLGRGGFATVYLAKNLRTNELVAVKRFHPPLSTAPDAEKKAKQAARRAVKEQRIWDGLSHKNVVSYRACFFGESGELNLVAEYIPGWSLADHLSQITKFPEHMVARIARQIVDGLDYLHKCGVTHRDVKPANILVHPSGLIKITDFGVSSAVDVPTMTGNALVGTPWYIAPEMLESRPYGKSVDIWSLGCTVLELATGRRPYHNLRAHAAMFRMTQDRHPPIPRTLSPKLRDFLKTCWVWKPEERPTPANLRRHPFLQNITDPALTDLANKERTV